MTDPVPAAEGWWVGTPGPGTIDDNLVGPINDLGHDTGIIDLTSPLANWTASTTPNFAVQRIGHLVTLYGSVQRTAGGTLAADGTWITGITTLPAGLDLAPSAAQGYQILKGCSGTPGVSIDWRINTDRTVDLRNVGTVALPVNGFAVTPGPWMVE